MINGVLFNMTVSR